MSQRIHLSLKVTDLVASVRFYNELLGVEPDLVRDDLVKWRVDSPPLNLAISPAAEAAVDHLGIENTDTEELERYVERFGERSDAVAEVQTQCCYARSDKLWIRSPDELSWELFQTHHAETDHAPSATGEPLHAELEAKDGPAAVADQGREMPQLQPGSGGGCC